MLIELRVCVVYNQVYYYSKGSVLALISSHSSRMASDEVFFARKKKSGLSLRDLCQHQHFLRGDRKHKTEGRRLISAKDFTEFKMKSGECIEIYLIL